MLNIYNIHKHICAHVSILYNMNTYKNTHMRTHTPSNSCQPRVDAARPALQFTQWLRMTQISCTLVPRRPGAPPSPPTPSPLRNFHVHFSKHPVVSLFTFQCPCDLTCSSSGKEKSEELNINISVWGPCCLPAPDGCLSKCYPEVSVATKEHSFHFLLPDMKLELAVLRNRTNRLPSFCLSLHVVLEGSSASAEFWWVVSMEDAM